MLTYHPVVSQKKVQQLAENIDENGWQGMPLVRWGNENLITGTHRYSAANRELGWTDSEIPMIDLEEVFAEDGKDFEALHAEYGFPTIDEAYFEEMMKELSDDIREKYGIDLY